MKLTVLALLLCAGGLVACSGDQPTPSDPTDARFAAADELFRQSDYEGAAKALEALRARLGDDPELAQRLGLAYERLDDLARAIMVYREALAEHPDAGALWAVLGDAYLDLRQFEAAVEALGKARDLGVEDQHTAMRLGICYGQLQDHEAAEREFERALQAGLEGTGVRYNIALLRVAERRYREAKELLDGVVAEDPQNYEARRELGNVLLQTSKDPETIADVLRLAWEAVDHRPEDWRAHMLLGDAFMAQQDYVAAVEAYTEALRFGKNPPEVEQRYIEAASQRRASEREQQDAETADGAQVPSTDLEQPEKLSR